jgi:hypothetical protein
MPYFHFLFAVYAYGLFFSEPWVDGSAETQLPHVFCMLSPRCEAMNFEFRHFEGMLAADCCSINDGAVFRVLGQAIHNPVADPFPLRIQEPFAAYGVDDLSSCQNVGLTTTDMEQIEERTDFVFAQTPRGITIHRAP